MIRSRHVCTALFCLIATGVHAQGQGAGQQNNNQNQKNAGFSQQDIRDRNQQNADAKTRQWDSTTGNLWTKGMTSVPKVREKLALEWQHLGVPADQATMIASTYRGDQGRLVQHASFQGKSGQEIASMLQGALKSKDYRLANQLLIDYERYKLQLEPVDANRPAAN